MSDPERMIARLQLASSEFHVWDRRVFVDAIDLIRDVMKDRDRWKRQAEASDAKHVAAEEELAGRDGR